MRKLTLSQKIISEIFNEKLFLALAKLELREHIAKLILRDLWQPVDRSQHIGPEYNGRTLTHLVSKLLQPLGQVSRFLFFFSHKNAKLGQLWSFEVVKQYPSIFSCRLSLVLAWIRKRTSTHNPICHESDRWHHLYLVRWPKENWSRRSVRRSVFLLRLLFSSFVYKLSRMHISWLFYA